MRAAGARPGGHHDDSDRCGRRRHDDRQVELLLPQRCEHLDAADARHTDVEEYNIGRPRLQMVERLLPADGDGDIKSAVLEPRSEQRAYFWVIVDDEGT